MSTSQPRQPKGQPTGGEFAGKHQSVDELSTLNRPTGYSTEPNDPEVPRRLIIGGKDLWVRSAMSDADTARHLEALPVRGVSVVGSRSCTMYGAELASQIGQDLSEQGKIVVNQADFGISGSAIRGALIAGGQPVVFSPSGINNPYPTAHAEFLSAVAKVGIVVSEHENPDQVPTQNGFRENVENFVSRTAATVVVEAASGTSAIRGALHAHSQGLPVYAFPGPVSSSASEGPHKLIKEGIATLVTWATDIG